MSQQVLQQPFFLGLDAGGTGCRARLSDQQGRILGEGSAGPANIRLGLERCVRELILATEHAFDQAGVSRDLMTEVPAGAGIAGLVTDETRSALESWQHPFANLRAETDAVTACLGAFGGNNGGILILGTGSCGMSCIDGKFSSLGGWGFPVSDQGSGAWLGLRLVRGALQAHERLRPATALTRAVMHHFGDSPSQVSQWMTHAEPRDYAAWAPLVVEYHQRRDAFAGELVEILCTEVEALLQCLWARDLQRVCLMGGLAPWVKSLLTTSVASRLVPAEGDALDGALILARGSVHA